MRCTTVLHGSHFEGLRNRHFFRITGQRFGFGQRRVERLQRRLIGGQRSGERHRKGEQLLACQRLVQRQIGAVDGGRGYAHRRLIGQVHLPDAVGAIGIGIGASLGGFLGGDQWRRRGRTVAVVGGIAGAGCWLGGWWSVQDDVFVEHDSGASTGGRR